MVYTDEDVKTGSGSKLVLQMISIVNMYLDLLHQTPDYFSTLHLLQAVAVMVILYSLISILDKSQFIREKILTCVRLERGAVAECNVLLVD